MKKPSVSIISRSKYSFSQYWFFSLVKLNLHVYTLLKQSYELNSWLDNISVCSQIPCQCGNDSTLKNSVFSTFKNSQNFAFKFWICYCNFTLKKKRKLNSSHPKSTFFVIELSFLWFFGIALNARYPEKFTLQLRFITFSLLIEDINLDSQISIGDGLNLQIIEDVKQL